GVGGSIVLNLSLHTDRIRNLPDYSVAKAGLKMLMKELAWALGPHGIRVNAVSPRAIDTWSDHVPDAAELIERSSKAIALGGGGKDGHGQRAERVVEVPGVAECRLCLGEQPLHVGGRRRPGQRCRTRHETLRDPRCQAEVPVEPLGFVQRRDGGARLPPAGG